MLELFRKLKTRLAAGESVVLVTIVKESGSSPRGVGAQLLVGGEGILYGTVGGGNAEYLAVKNAQKMLAEGIEYDCTDYSLRFQATNDVGMICGGDISLSFYLASGKDWITLTEEIENRLYNMLTGFLVLPADGSMPYLSDVPSVSPENCSIPLRGRERAVVFGGGHIASFLVPLLDTIGFRVTVFDDRPEYASSERFPTAENTFCGDYCSVFSAFPQSKDDYYVVMTNAHTHDFEVEKQILSGEYAYLGVVGSKKKTEAVNAKLREAGISEKAINSVYTPVGVAIRAVTPAEIAVSIAAEMILVRSERREGATPLHHDCPLHM